MFRNIKINLRIILLIVIQAVVLVSIAVFSEMGSRISDQSEERISVLSDQRLKLQAYSSSLRNELQGTVSKLNVGGITWEGARENLTAINESYVRGWEEVKRSLATADQTYAGEGAAAASSFEEALSELKALFEQRNRKTLDLFVMNDLDSLVTPFLEFLRDERLRAKSAMDAASAEARESNRMVQIGSTVTAGVGLLLGILFGVLVYRSINAPINRIAAVVKRVSEGDFGARTELRSKDELGVLGQAFDNLLQERVATLSQAVQENEALNDSIISLLQAVAQLSQRDLTVTVPVAEDVTGAVADALNLMTYETAEVLREVTEISTDVATASSRVKVQSDSALALAATEREQVATTAQQLNETAEALQNIAGVAGKTNEAAELAVQKTQLAVESVAETVDGINSGRDTIRETEKRIKRLGERSQEISVAVNLINNIAERTHILALNASMHAASAGEAGRGFAVVADEVQRLAENARQATSQIANLVSSIQAETSDTVVAMNAAIGQVVDGSRLAEQAGERMRETQQATTELAVSVQDIAASSVEQAKSSQSLREHARQIQTSTEQTSAELHEQAKHTNQLLAYAQRLVASVQVFRLPEKVVEAEVVEEEFDEAA